MPRPDQPRIVRSARTLPHATPPPRSLGPGTFPESTSLDRPVSRLRRILLATDGGYLAAGAVRFGAALAERTGAKVELAAIFEPRVPVPSPAPDEVTLTCETADREAVGMLCARARAQCRQIAGGTAAWPLHVTVGDVAAGVERIARAIDADLVIAGIGHASPDERRIDEGTANRLAYTGTVPVFAVAPDAAPTPRAALVHVDFDEASMAATKLALALLPPGGTAFLTYVRRRGSPRGVDAEESTWAIERLMKSLSSTDLREGVVVQHVVVEGSPVPALLAAARAHRADFIAAGMSGDSVEARTIMQNLAAPLLRSSPVSVLIVPEPRAVDALRAPVSARDSRSVVRRPPGSVD